MNVADLHTYLVSSGCNKHEAAITLIQACLDEGPQTGTDLRNTLVVLGYNRKHVRKVLETNAGPSLQRSAWERLDGDRYQAHH